MSSHFKYQLILQFIVLIWGFTGVLGDLIDMDSIRITFFRTSIAFLAVLPLLFLFRKGKRPTSPQVVHLLLVGVIVGLHWFAFFHAIKVSNVSIAVICMASSALFASILEPLILKRKFLASELFLSLATIAGMALIYGFEFQYYLGIIYGLICAFLSALFTVINGRYAAHISGAHMTLYEMLGAALTMGVFLLYRGDSFSAVFQSSSMDWIYLLILGVVCTVGTFMAAIWIMKYLTPFSISLSLNLEPIYAILIVLIIDYVNDTQQEQMSGGFYAGAAVILLAVFTNAYLKNRKPSRG